MTTSQKPYVIVFLGSIGSGKSHFARQLSDATNIVRLNSDAMRDAMGDEWTAEANLRLWGALDYTTEQLLLRGQSVIYDSARMNKTDSRTSIRKIAEKMHADVLIVWIETPREVAAHRAAHRDHKPDQRRFSEKEVEEIIDRHEQTFSPPQPGEQFVRLSGTASFEEQYQSFKEQIKQLNINL